MKTEPTPYACEVIVAAHRAGRRVAIVSNNSAAAVRAYLAARRLDDYVYPVVGRAFADPGRMNANKPGKPTRLAKADVLIDSMAELATEL